MGTMGVSIKDWEKAWEIGRPPNIKRLFPHSRALIVSGKVIDRAMLKKGKAMTMAANGRNYFVIAGVLKAAQRANAAVIIEIAKSEGGANAYCAVNYWNIAMYVDTLCNTMGITVPVAVHADHYGIKGQKDIIQAETEIPSIIEAGITSVAIDASHLPDADNLLTNIRLSRLLPPWIGYETEVGEIKGKEGLSTVEEALFLIEGLNAHNIFPDWIALNNGTTHGIEASDAGIQVELTRDIHKALERYKVSGAQHGTSGNNTERLKRIASETRTTKANVATALQMISWGVKVNEFGNAQLDQNGELIKEPEKGVTREIWEEMVAYAKSKGLKAGDFKKLNLPFENKLMGLPKQIRERMVKDVEDFAYDMLTQVFNAGDTAPLAIEAILEGNSYDLGPKATRIQDPNDWTGEKIREKAKRLTGSKGPEGDFED